MPDQAVLLGLEAGAARAATSLFPLEVRSLSYAVSGKRLLNDLSLQIGARPVTVVMGPNGAGKSLLLRLLHGLIEPTSGHILWGGRPLTSDLRRRQAMVFQRPVLLRRSVIANVAFALKARGTGSTERCIALLEHVGLETHANKPARRLSGGEQQRLALARALAVEPEVLFLDEPTASLDPSATAAIEGIVTAAHRRGTKIIFVTHNIGQARRLADEVVFLHAGRLVEHEPATKFFTQPSSPEAQGYLEGRLVF
jgi:tungstate transport system ATP-binding protein